jgi:hypothetical protein
MQVIKKQSVIALAVVVLIPVVVITGGMLSNLIDPEIAARHPHYSRNFQLLSMLKHTIFLGSIALAGVLWMLGCLLVIRGKKRSLLWLVMAVFGPVGFAVLATLKDRGAMEADGYARFVGRMNGLVRAGYEVCCFAGIWMLAYELMVLNRNAIIEYQAITQGVSTQQIIDLQDASGGMWAFAEGNEVMYLVVLLYVLRPVVVSLLGSAMTMRGVTGKAGGASGRS